MPPQPNDDAAAGALSKPKRNLPTIAAEIREEVDAAEASWRDAVGHAIRAGELLIEAKSHVAHGQWLPWLKANFPGSARSAQGYMQLADHAEDARRFAHLGVGGALKELAAPNEEDARSVAHSDGIPETVAEIKEMAASDAVSLLRIDHMEEVFERFDAEKPTLEDSHRQVAELFPEQSKRDRQWIAEARHQLALIEHSDDKLEVWYRVVIANAGELIAEAADRGLLLIAKASTGITFLRARRRCEQASEEEWDERHADAQKAWMAHRAARDAEYRADGETPMDERPLDFNDAMYHPDLQGWRDTADEDAAEDEQPHKED